MLLTAKGDKMLYTENIEKNLLEAKEVRKKLNKFEGVVVGKKRNPPMGLYLLNYANLLMDRQIDIFDDAILLLDNKRYQAACIISRGMIETHAFSRLLNNSVEKILRNHTGLESVDKALDVILKFTNSSRFKKIEQTKIKDGIFNPDDYMFTEQAKYRFENFLAASQHVAEALRKMYEEEKAQTQHKESQFEITYDALSEYVHPSQISIFNYYTPDIHLTPTSFGDIHTYDSARFLCARALHFIVDAENQHHWSTLLAQEMTNRSVMN